MQKKFSPLSFLAAVGAGGISIIPFAFLNYTVPHAKGLIKLADLTAGTWSVWQEILFYGLEVVMLVFAFLHVLLLISLFHRFFHFLGSSDYTELMENPLKNNSILTPFIALAMTMNVLIGPVRFFVPTLSQNLQLLMLPALLVWLVLLLAFFRLEIKTLKSLFLKSVDLTKVGFGWLLDVFALSMLAVTGSGIAALAKSPAIAHTAAFFSLMGASMAIFFLVIKVVLVFQKHFAEKSLPEKQFLPSFLNLVPAVTLLTITFFRLGHYLEAQFSFHIDWYFTLLVTGAFAFETWYLIFGLALLKDYFLQHHFEREHYPAQWALICPFVAYGVLGSFVYSVFVPSPILIAVILLSLVVSILLFADLLIRHLRCGRGSISCMDL